MNDMLSSDPPDGPHELTSYHVRHARDGDPKSLEWLIRKFTPLLLANARYRLGKILGELYDPEDIVSDVWAVALPRISELAARDGRFTPVLLKFLSTTLLFRVNNLVQKHIQGKPRRERHENARSIDGQLGIDLAQESTGILTRMAREETRDAIAESLAQLDETDRELIILRGIEQQPYKDIALVLRADTKVLAVKYRRALQKLREKLPGSVYDEFAQE